MVIWAGLQAKLNGGGQRGRLCKRLINMENERLIKNVFMWDKSVCKHN